MKIDWKRKLTSRKFWVAVVGFVTALMVGFGVGESTAAEVTAIITAGATLIAYIVGEGIVDASGKNVPFDKGATETHVVGFADTEE